MKTVLSNYYDDLEETLNHLISLKLNRYTGENFAYWFDTILVGDDIIESVGAFKSDQLSYITWIIEDTYDYMFYLWEIKKYMEVTEFIKKLRMCDKDVMQPKSLITYEFLVKEAMHE